MQEGLLWLDADPKRDLAEKVGRAADRYHFKFGRRPNLCYVNPSMLSSLSRPGQDRPGQASQDRKMGNGSIQLDGVRLVPAANVLKHHFWIGVEESAELREAA